MSNMKLVQDHKTGGAGRHLRTLVLACATFVMLAAFAAAPLRALAADIETLDIHQVYSTTGQVPEAWVDGTFEYELTAVDGAPLPAGATGDVYSFTITGTADKAIALRTRAEAAADTISFDTVGVYEYTLRCVTDASDEHLWLDGKSYRVSVTVENDAEGDGIHVARLVVKDDQGTKPDRIEFDPTYTGETVPPEKPAKPGRTIFGVRLPQTSDPIWGMAVFSGILLAAAAVAITLGLWLKRHKKHEDKPTE